MKTFNAKMILSVFLTIPGEEYTVPEIMRETKLGFLTVYPILSRMERLGWIKAESERQVDPYRRHYMLTDYGMKCARDQDEIKKAFASPMRLKLRFVRSFFQVVATTYPGVFNKDIERLRREYLEAFHRPTDGRLDYCECGESWPCKRRRKWET